MKKLITEINRAPVQDYSVEDWNASVKQFFGPYIRRKSILTRQKEILRTELVNLAKVESSLEYSKLLLILVRKYRSIIYRDQISALRFLAECFEEHVRADERWMSLFISYEPLPKESPLYDRVFQLFGTLDAILEGSYKHQLRIVFGFAAREQTNLFLRDIFKRDFGMLRSHISDTYSPKAQLLIEDPEHGIPVNQWRNIASHKSFAVKTRSTIEIWFGRNSPVSKRITHASLTRVINWVTQSLATARMANLITYLEFMPELKKSKILPDISLRLESSMVTLCHNLHIVGFECINYGGERDVFVLYLRDRLNRFIFDAIIHASQALDQVTLALENDPTRVRFNFIAVNLLDAEENITAKASIQIEDITAYAQHKLTQKQLVERINFDFSDWESVSYELQQRSNDKNES